MAIGKAYGFFYCHATRQQIETELLTIRDMVNTPSQLELSLVEGMDELIGPKGALRKIDPRLSKIAQEAKEGGINYLLQATYSGGTHEDTANEVAAILNQAYQSPLYNEGDTFKGAIVYEEKGDYIFRE
jgi:hypothetical protein